MTFGKKNLTTYLTLLLGKASKYYCYSVYIFKFLLSLIKLPKHRWVDHQNILATLFFLMPGARPKH